VLLLRIILAEPLNYKMFPGAPQKTMKQRYNTIFKPATQEDKKLRDNYLKTFGLFAVTTFVFAYWRKEIGNALDFSAD
jgi:hypothetical protein